MSKSVSNQVKNFLKLYIHLPIFSKVCPIGSSLNFSFSTIAVLSFCIIICLNLIVGESLILRANNQMPVGVRPLGMGSSFTAIADVLEDSDESMSNFADVLRGAVRFPFSKASAIANRRLISANLASRLPTCFNSIRNSPVAAR